MNRIFFVVIATCSLGLPAFWSSVLRAQPRKLIEQYSADEASLKFKYRNPTSTTTLNRLAEFYSVWKTRAARHSFEGLGIDERIDVLLLREQTQQKYDRIQRELARVEVVDRVVPFLQPLYQMLEAHEKTRESNARQIAETMESVSSRIDSFDSSIVQLFADSNQTVLARAIEKQSDLQRALDEFDHFHRGYDPEYSWWVDRPFTKLKDRLKKHEDLLKSALYGGRDPESVLIGKPIGKQALQEELAHEFIPYSPEELIEIANQELIWCDNEMRKAARELGYNNWKDAQEHVKSRFVPPGQQPRLINELANEAVGYLESNNLITVPAVAKETWRMRMMSPARQKMSPYFLGGPTILVSYPTDTMDHRDKLMSLRGNNPHFARATVHHELIPGHHLQFFMNKRNKPYRQAFNSPFWLEGWAVYWEMLLWDLGFARSAEDRIGMLFWRKHRCARVIFSLNYHLKQMTAGECVDFLIERVGHERNNAMAEVRRSIQGGYGPLYQAAYLIGALQFRRLHEEFVQSGKMTNREFHDSVLKENSLPVELLRAKLSGTEPGSDFRPGWKFYQRN